MLSPAADATVCAGNVLTSQRVTNVILKAFGAAAASRGTMNNFTFGDAGTGTETIAGGSGAGPWEGTSAVRCHMTNTRMTDVEIMEKRYPVIVDTFALRRGSGGAGARGGGCGVVREVTFLRDGITASLLTERRAVAPFGLAGGGAARARPQHAAPPAGGARRAAAEIALGIECKFAVGRGDTVRISTPGGGSHGAGDGGGGRKRKGVEDAAGGGGGRRTASTALSSNDVEF